MVAAQWRVSELVALVTMRKFYEHFDRGTLPAQALTQAQIWLRSATHEDLCDAYPDLFTARLAASRIARARQQPVYGNPSDWAAFSYTGI